MHQSYDEEPKQHKPPAPFLSVPFPLDETGKRIVTLSIPENMDRDETVHLLKWMKAYFGM